MFIINIISSAATHVLRLIITAGVALDSVIFPHHRCSYSMVSDCKSDTTESKKSDTTKHPLSKEG